MQIALIDGAGALYPSYLQKSLIEINNQDFTKNYTRQMWKFT